MDDKAMNKRGSASRNPAAYRSSQRSSKQSRSSASGTSNSKHTDAAALALNLAARGPWSERFVPSDISIRRLSEGGIADTSRSSPMLDLDLEPPPAYTFDSNEDILEPEANDMHRHFDRESAVVEYDGDDLDEQQYRDSIDAPMLQASQEKVDVPSSRWTLKPTYLNQRLSPRFSICTGLVIIAICMTVAVLALSQARRSPFQREYPLLAGASAYEQRETYKDIRGSFELHDRLELTTTTGNIDIQVDPQPGNGTSELILATTTGNIKLGLSESWWMRRNRSTRPIRTEIKTTSGDVRGRIVLGTGSSAIVETVTGMQDVRVYVFKVEGSNGLSELTTRSTLGDQVVAVTNFDAYDSTFDGLKAEHHSSATANLDLQYSHAWRGIVHATSDHGKIDVQGDAGMKFDKQGDREVVAHKGNATDANTVRVVGKGIGNIVFKAWYTW